MVNVLRCSVHLALLLFCIVYMLHFCSFAYALYHYSCLLFGSNITITSLIKCILCQPLARNFMLNQCFLMIALEHDHNVAAESSSRRVLICRQRVFQNHLYIIYMLWCGFLFTKPNRSRSEPS